MKEGWAMEEEKYPERAGSGMFTEMQARILRAVQADMPQSLTPYADIAAIAGTDEDSVIRFLRELKEKGFIRRFGASIRHQRVGYAYNIMVVWKVDEARKDEAGRIAAAHPSVSHCYFRPAIAQDWPYTLYTMIHGRSRAECAAVIASLQERSSVFAEYRALESLKELKKVSPVYF